MPNIVLNILLLSLAALVGKPAAAERSMVEREMLAKLADCVPLTLNCLRDQGLTVERGPHVFVLINTNIKMSHELVTAARFAEVTRQPVLVLPNLHLLNDIPVIDAIAFDGNGPAIANVSFKRILVGRGADGGEVVARALTKAHRILRNLYSDHFLWERLNLTRDNDGDYWSGYSAAETTSRVQMLETLRHLLGFETSGPRPAWIAVDFHESEWSFEASFAAGGADPKHINFVTVDNLVSAKRMSMNTLRRHAHEVYARYLFMDHGASLSIEPGLLSPPAACQLGLAEASAVEAGVTALPERQL